MIRNSVTLYEDDAWDVVFALRDLVDMLTEHEEPSRRIENYKEHLTELADSIEKTIR